jgi:hypothetical protein
VATSLLALTALLANHTPATRSGDTNPAVGVVFGGIVATAAWLLFSKLQWRYTVAVTVAGWAAIAGLLIAL